MIILRFNTIYYHGIFGCFYYHFMDSRFTFDIEFLGYQIVLMVGNGYGNENAKIQLLFYIPFWFDIE